MAQALIRKLDDRTLADYRAAAKAKGRSLEAELRDLIERNRPNRTRSRDELRALSERACSLTIGGIGTDSTSYIRWIRETDGGRSPGPVPDNLR